MEESFHEANKANPNYICPHCGKQLDTASGHRRHMLGHGEKPLKCLICDKTFVEASLRRPCQSTPENSAIYLSPLQEAFLV